MEEQDAAFPARTLAVHSHVIVHRRMRADKRGDIVAILEIHMACKERKVDQSIKQNCQGGRWEQKQGHRTCCYTLTGL